MGLTWEEKVKKVTFRRKGQKPKMPRTLSSSLIISDNKTKHTSFGADMVSNRSNPEHERKYCTSRNLDDRLKVLQT